MRDSSFGDWISCKGQGVARSLVGNLASACKNRAARILRHPDAEPIGVIAFSAVAKRREMRSSLLMSGRIARPTASTAVVSAAAPEEPLRETYPPPGSVESKSTPGAKIPRPFRYFGPTGSLFWSRLPTATTCSNAAGKKG
jgi:hypothetical protein